MLPTASRGEEQRALVDLVRQNVRDLTPYRCARDDYSGGTLLDANENSIGPALAPSKVRLMPKSAQWIIAVAGRLHFPSSRGSHSLEIPVEPRELTLRHSAARAAKGTAADRFVSEVVDNAPSRAGAYGRQMLVALVRNACL